ncbi:MAG: restriction endonuclease subunit S [Sediminibacterium sp.]
MKWDKVKLEDVSIIIAGQSPESKYYNQDGLGLPFFQGKADFGLETPKVRYWCTKPTKVAQASDILLSVRAPVGPTNICNIESCIGRGIAAIRVGERLNYRYLYWWFKSFEKQLSAMGNGSTFSAITSKVVRDLEIPLPPLHIQEQIVITLDKADAIRRKDQELLTKYDELAQTIFYDMFGDPVRNNKGWNVKTVIEVADCIVPGRDKPKSFTGNIPWVTTDDLKHLGTTNNSKKNIGLSDTEIKEVRAKIIPKNSVIMTCVGDLGIISIAGTDMVINQQLHAFQTKDINPTFLMYLLSLRKDFMIKMASSTTVPYMNKTVCNSIPVILPPKEMQEKFTSIYTGIKSQIDLSLKSFKNSTNLNEMLTVKYFS